MLGELGSLDADKGLHLHYRSAVIMHDLRRLWRLARWLAIADTGVAQSTWDGARIDLGLTVRQAIGASLLKLFCWHWVQPAACVLPSSTIYLCRH